VLFGCSGGGIEKQRRALTLHERAFPGIEPRKARERKGNVVNGEDEGARKVFVRGTAILIKLVLRLVGGMRVCGGSLGSETAVIKKKDKFEGRGARRRIKRRFRWGKKGKNRRILRWPREVLCCEKESP